MIQQIASAEKPRKDVFLIIRLHEEARRSDLFILSEKVFYSSTIGWVILIQQIASAEKPRKDFFLIIRLHEEARRSDLFVMST